MILDVLRGGGEVSEDVLRHIRECDRMYREVYGDSNTASDCSACKKLMMGFHLTPINLPELCIIHCERWKLPVDESQPIVVERRTPEVITATVRHQSMPKATPEMLI